MNRITDVSYTAVLIVKWSPRHLFSVIFHVVKLGQDNDLSEFDESRDIIESLVDEYKACESPDYIKWGMEVHDLLV